MVLSYYVAGNTAVGRVNVLATNVEDFNHIIILKHPSPQVKTNCLREWMRKHIDEETDLELLESIEGKRFLDGVILRNEGVAIISDTIINDSIENAHTIDLTSYILDTEIGLQSVYTHKKNMSELQEKSWTSFATGLKIHDDLEHIYIRHMDFNKADQVALQWKQHYLPTERKKNQKGHVRKRLFGTNTADGAINIVPEMIAPFSVVHHVKGRAGTGKSHFMNAVSDACIQLGYDVEQYICSFDPKSTDMIIVRDLNICLLDSTNPHEFTPNKGDVVIDLYEETVEPGTDERYEESINQTTKKYKSFMKKGIRYLKEARQEQHIIDEIYVHQFSTKVINSIIDSIEKIRLK